MGESISHQLEDSDRDSCSDIYSIETELKRNSKYETIRLKRPSPKKTILKQTKPTIQIQIAYTSTIRELKKKIGSKVGLDTGSFSLCIPTNLKTLDRNELKLSDYGISGSNGRLFLINSRDRNDHKSAVPVYVMPLKKEPKQFTYQQWINSSMGYKT
eukprot:UN11311